MASKTSLATYSAAAVLDGKPGQYFTFPNEGLVMAVAFRRRHGFTCPQEKSCLLGFGFGFCICRSSSFCPLLSWKQRAGSGSLSQDARASSPVCPPKQLCFTSPAMLTVPDLIGFFAVPFFAKCFYVMYEKDGNMQLGEKYTSIQRLSLNIYYLLPNSHQSQ